MPSSLFNWICLRARVARALGLCALGLLLCFVFLPRGSHASGQDGAVADVPSAKSEHRAEFVPGEILVRFRGDTMTGKQSAPVALTLSTERGTLPVSVERFAASDAVEGL